MGDTIHNMDTPIGHVFQDLPIESQDISPGRVKNNGAFQWGYPNSWMVNGQSH